MTEKNRSQILPDSVVDPLTNGLFGSKMYEQVPTYFATSAEDVKSNGNAWIVLGRDRPAGVGSGYSGVSDTRSSAIDIVVGRQGFDPSSEKSVDPNFGTVPGRPGDSARIYMSQRANIDEYFGLHPGGMGNSSGTSAIALKADDVRIISRKGVKIVTGRAPVQKDSILRKNQFISGVELIAGNLGDAKYLQPMVKGANLVKALKSMASAIEDINIFLAEFVTLQTQFNSSVVSDVKYGFAGPVPVYSTSGLGLVTKSAETTIKNYNEVFELFLQRKIKFTAFGIDYLSPAGAEWICSRYNRVN